MEPKPISSQIKGGTQSIVSFNDYADFAGTTQEEILIAKEAIKNSRITKYKEFRKVQYHTNYKDFAMPLKEKNLLPDGITAKRHQYFEMFCTDALNDGYLKFAGTKDEEEKIGLTAVIEFRIKKKEITDEQKYWQKVYNQPTVAPQKKYNTDDFYNYIITERADQVFGIHKTGPNAGKSKFKLDFQSQPIVEMLCEYFTSNPKFEERFFEDENPETKETEKIMFSLDKGLLLFSKCGFGKTDTMRLFACNQKQSFRVVNCLTAEEDFSIDGDDGIRKYYTNLPNPNPHLFYGHTNFGICFDNFGLEKDAKYYGSGENVMEKILFQRYHRRHELEGKTHLTTNFGRDYIKDRYGPAIYSRFFELFNFITFSDGSVDRRKTR